VHRCMERGGGEIGVAVSVAEARGASGAFYRPGGQEGRQFDEGKGPTVVHSFNAFNAQPFSEGN
jgi:hypothetical protein